MLNRILRIAVFAGALSSMVLAQGVTATILGTVTDASGASVSGATITVQNVSKGNTRTAKSGGSGEFEFGQLTPADTYTVTVQLQGFKQAAKSGIVLQTGQSLRIDLSLSPGEVTETITVAAEAAQLQTEEASTGGVVGEKQVAELPLNGRQFWQLSQLVPNVFPPTQNSGLGFRGGFNVSGHDEVTNNYILDGVDNEDGTTMQPTVRPSVDGIQEFRVLTGIYQAEYGRYAGGQILITTKSGNNQFHGTAFEFLRNSALDARNFFSPGAVPPFRRNQFGASGGGRIVPNKTFFFGTYEGLRASSQSSGITSVPTAAMARGDVTGLAGITAAARTNYGIGTDNIIPASRLDKTSLALLKYYPAPTGPGVLNNYNYSLVGSENTNQFSGRIDHVLGARDTIFGTYQYSKRITNWQNNTLCGTNVLPHFGCTEPEKAQGLAVNYVHTFSPTLINELRGGFNKLTTSRIQEDADLGNVGAQLGIPQQGVPDPKLIGVLGVPRVTVTGYGTLGGPNNTPQGRRTPTYNFVDSLAYIRGTHTIKVGGDFKFFLLNYADPAYFQARGTFGFNGQYTGNAMADYLVGGLRSTAGLGGAPLHNTRTPSAAFFVQDDWKATNRLTINLGVRYELFFPSYEVNNKITSFDPKTGLMPVADGRLLDVNRTTGALITVTGTSPIGNHAWALARKNFAPRIGFAYRPFGDNKTVVRGGFGIFNNQIADGNGVSGIYRGIPFRLNQAFTNTATQQLATWLNPYPAGTAVGGFTGIGIVYDLKTAYVAQWSAGLQRQLLPSLLLDMTYLGSKGTHLPLNYNINQPAAPGVAALQSRRPYTQWGAITWVDGIGNSTYHSLAMRLEKRYSKGLSSLVSYTWSHSIDGGANPAGSGDGEAGIMDISNLRSNTGTSSFDVRQRLVTSLVYELPFGKGKSFGANANPVLNAIISGWQTNGIFTFQAGSPFTVITNSDLSNTGGNNRPFVIGEPHSDSPTVDKWFNTAAYRNSVPVTGVPAFGNAPRNDLTGPSLKNVDFGLSRNISATERLKVQFRAELFNIFNHANFGLPLHDASSAGTFGKITQTASDSRKIQFGLKLVF